MLTVHTNWMLVKILNYSYKTAGQNTVNKIHLFKSLLEICSNSQRHYLQTIVFMSKVFLCFRHCKQIIISKWCDSVKHTWRHGPL